MITTGILNVIWGIACPLVELMPAVEINYNGIANSTVFQFLRAGMYMLPVGTVVTILGIVLSLWVFRVVIAFLHSLWASLPIV